MSEFYPQNPLEANKDLTKLSKAYFVKSIVAIASIILFFLFYLTLVASFGYLLYLAVTYEIGVIKDSSILIKIGSILGALALFTFTLKFIFKLNNQQPTNRIALPQNEYPELWDFVFQICTDTGAPKPAMIYADPDVNAYVKYTHAWLSLFLPVKKELTLGLGLVNGLTLSEFKAVVSHEFGHFSQSSMKIGSYINSANTIIHNLIYTRDKWDEALDKWKSIDLRLSIAAWIITPIIALIRFLLGLFYKLLNLLQSSLSREMEFNADKYAVLTSGSDSITSSLYKLDFAFEAWETTCNFAYMSLKSQLAIPNLYELLDLQWSQKEPALLESLTKLPNHPHGGLQFFATRSSSHVDMYASHPDNYDRETNAKYPFVDCPQDNRSPWILFGKKEHLQARMTTLIYTEYFQYNGERTSTINDFKLYLETETKTQSLLDEYQNTFQDRFLDFSEKPVEVVDVDWSSKDSVKVKYQNLMNELNDKTKIIRLLSDTLQKAEVLFESQNPSEQIEFEGKFYHASEVEEIYPKILESRQELIDHSFTNWDHQWIAFHLEIATRVNQKTSLEKIYAQHQRIIKLFRLAITSIQQFDQTSDQFSEMDEVGHLDVIQFLTLTQDALQKADLILNEFSDENFIPLPNADSLSHFRNWICPTGKFYQKNLGLKELDEINTNYSVMSQLRSHLQFLDQRSIAKILMTHDEIRTQFLRQEELVAESVP